jgi:predicted PurR-regulated permease PerM
MIDKMKMAGVKKGNVLINVAALIIVVAGMRAASSILIPIMLAIFIAAIFMPPFLWLKRKGIPTALSLIIVIICILIIGFLLVTLIHTALSDFSNAIPQYKNIINVQDIEQKLEQTGLIIPDNIMKKYFDPNMLVELIRKILSSVGGVLSNTLLIVLIVIFILLEAWDFPNKIKASFDDPKASMKRVTIFMDNIQNYIVIKSTISLLTGIIIASSLAIIGVDFPLLWGLLAFLLNYIPTIGSIIAAIPAVFWTLVQLGPGPALLAGVVFLVTNFIMGSIIEPRYMGRGLGLSTLVVFLSLVFWGWVFGPIGMLLSVPLTMTVKIALDSSEDTLWMATLIGSKVPSTQSSDSSSIRKSSQRNGNENS